MTRAATWSMVANILLADPPTLSGVEGVFKVSKFIFFSEHGHVAYQIKGNDACSNMVANTLTADPSTPTLGVWSKGQNST